MRKKRVDPALVLWSAAIVLFAGAFFLGRATLRGDASDNIPGVPGVGEKTAERILAYRDTYGKFVTVEQLLDVEGIGEGLLEQLRPYVYVEESE